jgi:hypothetical protein
MGSLTLFDAGVASLSGSNDVDVLSAVLTGSGTAGNLNFTDIDAIQLGLINVTGTLTITSGTATAGAITQSVDGITVGGTSTFTASQKTGGQAITLDNSAYNNFGGAVNLINAGAFNVAISDQNALTLGTLTIPTGNLTVASTGALNLGAGTVGGNLTATSNGGAINQTASGGLSVGGNLSLNSNGGVISLTDAGRLSVGGNMSLLSNGGAISQTGTSMSVGGTSLISAGAASISLDYRISNVPQNSFAGVVTLSNSGSANGIALSDGTGNLTIGDITSAGAVVITATGAGKTLLFSGAYGGLTGSLSATAESSSGTTALTISNPMANISSATLVTDGVFTLGGNLGNNPGVASATTTTSISLQSDSA